MKNLIFQVCFLFCFVYVALLLNADVPPEKSFDQSLIAIHDTRSLSTANKCVHKVMNKIDQKMGEVDQKVTSSSFLKKKKNDTDSSR